MGKWLDDKLQEEIKAIFETRYKRKLCKEEVLEIGENLVNGMEDILRYKWREKNGKNIRNY